MPARSSSAERTALLRRSTSPSLSDGDGKDVEQEISTSRGAFILVFVGLLIFLQATNISILTTTQTAIASDLDAFEVASWMTSAYLIAMSSVAPLMGRLCQVFSVRLCLFFSTLLISTGSTITATSMSFDQFIVGRVVTGAGGGGIFIVTSIMAIQMTSPKRRGLYMGLANTGMTVGVSLGAVLAGALEPKIGWKPLFGFQAPLSLLCGVGLLFSIPASHTSKNAAYKDLSVRQKLARIDYPGALLLTTTIVLFLLGLSGPRVLFTPLILSAIALPIFVLTEIYAAQDPIIPISVLKSRGVLLSCLSTLGYFVGRWGILFYTPVYALAVRGWAPAVSGTLLIPTNAGFATGGLLAGVFHIKRTGSFYLHTLIAMTLFPVTMAVLAFISTSNSPWGLYVVMVFLNGFVTGGATNYALVHLLHLTLPEVHPIVISLLATFRGFSGSFGSAIGGGFFMRVLHRSLSNGFAEAGLTHRDDLIRRLLGSPALVSRLEGKERDVAVSGYEDGLKALFLGAAVLTAIAAVVQSGTGWKEAVQEEAEVEDEEEANSGA